MAVGHDPQSVWPGVDGAAVFLAHDVSYFVHLNALKPGDIVTYATACNTVKFEVRSQQVVPAGSPVATTSDPQPGPRHLLAAERARSSLLTACWSGRPRWARPPGAPAWIRARNSSRRCRPPTSGPSAPSALQAQGLTLEQNEAPMGTMNLVGASQAFAQSPGPLSLEAAALETYFGGLHALAQRQSPWWSALAPGVAMPSQLNGATVAGHDSPLEVEIDSAGGNPSQVVLRTTVTLGGGPAPGPHAMTVVLPVHSGVVTIGSWSLG